MLELIVMVAAVVGIPALLLGLARLILTDVPDKGKSDPWSGLFRDGAPRWDRLWPVAVALGLALLIFALGSGPRRGGDSEFLVFLVALAVLGLFLHAWRREFLFLMERRDDEFPGRLDKWTWTVLLIVLAPIGVWFFRSYRLAHWPEPRPEPAPARGEAAADLS